MEFLLDPGIWVSLLTLIILEIVLGIDNLVFIAILAEKLPPEQRDKARVIGLSLALLMRLGLLFIITWLVTLTRPLINKRIKSRPENVQSKTVISGRVNVTGLSLALLMRLGLLFIITWLVTLTRPLITVLDWTFSGAIR